MIAGQISIELAANIARLQRDMARAGRVVDNAMGGMLRAAQSVMGALAGIGAGFSLGALTQQLVGAQRQFDKLNSSLVTVTGSAEGANQAYAKLQNFAANTPFDLKQVTEAFIQLKSLGLTPSERALTSFGNTATAKGKDLKSVVEAVADAATGEFERLKEAFGIISEQAGDKVSFTFQGVTTTIRKNAKDIEEYLTRIGEVQFAGGMARQAATLDGALSNLADSYEALKLSFAQSIIGDATQDAVRKLAAALDSLGKSAPAIIDAFATAAKVAVAYFGIFKVAPAVYTAVAGALTRLTGAVAIYAMNVAIGQANTIGLNTTLWGTSVAAQMAAGSLTKAALAGKLLFALFAGWQLGKFFEEHSTKVKIFAEVLTGAVLEMWEHIKLGSKLALDAMTVMWRATFSGLTASLAPVYETIAAGLRKVGFDEKAGQIQEFADRVRAAGESQGTFASRTAEARAEHERNIKAIRQVTDSHVAAIIVADQVSEATRGVAAAAAAATAEKKEMSKEEKKALQAAQDFIDSQEKELEAIGKTEDQQRMLNAARAAAAAPLEAQRKAIMANALAITAEKQAWEKSEAARKAVEDAVGANAETMLQLQERARGLELEIELHGKTAEAAVYAEAAKVRATASSLAISEEYRAELIKQAEELDRIGGLVAKKAALDANQKAAEEAAREWERVGDSLTDNIMRGGKSAAEYLRDLFRTLVLKPIIQPIGNAVGNFVNGAMGMPGAAQAAGGGLSAVAGAASNLYGLVTGGATLAGGLGTGFLGSLAGGLNGAGIGSGLTSALGMNIGNSIASVVGPNVASGIASGLSGLAAAAPWVAGALAVYTIGKKAFGRGPKEFTGEQTLNGSLGAGGFMGTLDAEWVKKGGWFRSDKSGVDRNAVGAEMSAGLTSAYDAIKTSSADFARVLGINADSIASRSQAISIAMGKDEAANQKAIADFFVGVGNTIAGELLPEIGKFQTQGEAASATLQRLAAGYSTIEQALWSIGMSFGAVGTASLEARERLLAAAGGIEAFAANTAGFQQNFLSEAERNAPVLKMVTEQMAALGLASVDTRDEFKQVVLGLDLTTEAGAKQYGALMNLQAAFAQVYPTAEALAAALAEQEEAARRAADATLQAAEAQARAAEEARQAAIQATKDRAATLLSGVDSMFSALQSVVSREKSLLEQSANAHRALSQALRGTLDSMSATVQGLGDRQGARAQIQAALAIAKAGGVLPDADSLKGALSVLSKDASSMFATQQDYLRDFYSTQNDIAALAGLTDDALSVEEKSLKALDGILESAQQQINALKGLDTSTLTLIEVMRGFKGALGAAQADPVAGAGGSIAKLYQELLGRPADSAGLDYWQNAVAGGMSLDQVRKMIMQGSEYQLRGFAVGTNYVPTNMPAMIHEGERIIPAADNRELMRRLSSPSDNSAVLAAAVERLTATVAKQQAALDEIKESTKRNADMFEQATAGGGPLLVEIAQ